MNGGVCEGDVNVVKKKVCNFTGINGTNAYPAVFVYFIRFKGCFTTSYYQ